MKRIIPFAPQYSITRSGRVWQNRNSVPPFTQDGTYGLKHLCVRINEERHFIWRILSQVWYDNGLILTRDGGYLNWSEDNVFVVRIPEKSKWFDASKVGEIQWVWWCYQHERIWCHSMGERSGLLVYSVDEYKELIRAILISSVK